MSPQQRNSFSSQYKAKVALAAIGGGHTVNEIAREFGVHPTQVGLWKKVLLERAAGLFDARRGPRTLDQFASQQQLCAEIGRLKAELDRLK